MKPTATHFSRIWKLALPISIGHLGNFMMGFVDLLCVGKLGPEATAAVGVATSVHSFVCAGGFALLSGLEYWSSYSVGARKRYRSRQHAVQGLWIAFTGSIAIIALLYGVGIGLKSWVKDPLQAALTTPYLFIFSLSTIPAFFGMTLRTYQQSLGIAFPGMVIFLLGNIINLFGNFALVFGKWGFPAMGVNGSAIATLISRVLIAAAFAFVLWRVDRRFFVFIRKKSNLLPKLKMIHAQLKIGIPFSIQIMLEFGLFCITTLFASRFGSIPAAAHQSALNLAAMMFMVPMGIGVATSVLVAQNLGAKNLSAMKAFGNLGILFGVGFMTFTSLLLSLFPREILSLYTTSPEVLALGTQLIFFAALFQISDGLQVTAAGALRGLGKTKLSMFSNLIGYWAIGCPIGFTLAFYFKMELIGLWIGLVAGLITSSGGLLYFWRKESARLTAQLQAQ